MNFINFVAIFALFIFAYYVMQFGAKQAIPKTLRSQNINKTILPTWVIVLISLLAVLPVVPSIFTPGFGEKDITGPQVFFCGSWLVGSFVLGFIIEKVIWTAFPQKASDWVQKQKEQLASADVQRHSDAKVGKFDCWARENAKELSGSYCFLYSTQRSNLVLTNDGVNFSNLLMYRNKTSAAIGGNMQSATATSLLATAATTHTISLSIPWNNIKGIYTVSIPDCTVNYGGKEPDNGSKYRILSFYNQSAKRDEWIGFGVIRADEEDVQNAFEEILRTHNVQMSTENPLN